MTTAYSKQQILDILIGEIADCLAIEREEVWAEATFFGELSGESIDLLDVTFRMQKLCGVRAPFQEILQGLEFDSNGKLSSDSIEQLSARFPLIEWTLHVDKMSGGNPRDLLTVDLIAELLFDSQSKNIEKHFDALPN